MIKIGDICPLFFNPIKNKFQQDIDYIQRFHTNDNVLIQIFSNNSSHTVRAYLRNLIAGTQSSISLLEYEVNDSTKMYYSNITGLSDSVYKIEVVDASGNFYVLSEPFAVCSDSLMLEETSLISYSHKDNNSPFDNIFWIDDAQQVFNFRLEAGFKPGGFSPKIENEQFRNQKQEIIELYSIPYDAFSLTCGNASGIPYWFAQFINKILCVSDFRINGKGYVRSGNSTPEMSPVSEDGQMFSVSIILEPLENEISGVGGVPGKPSVTIDQDTLSVIRQGGDYTIHVSSNTDWQIDYHPSWVTLSQESGGAGEFDITVTVSPNTTDAAREDYIGFITVVEGGEGANCVVTQTAEGDYLVLSPVNLDFGTSLEPMKVVVASKRPWNAYIL